MDRMDRRDFAQADAREQENQQAIGDLLQFAASKFPELDRDGNSVVTRQELGLARGSQQIDQQKLTALEINFDTLKGFDSSGTQGLTRAALQQADVLLRNRRDGFLRATTIRDGLLHSFDRLDTNQDQTLSYTEINSGRADRAGSNGTIAALFAIDELRELGRPMGAVPLGVMSRDDYVVSRDDLATYPMRALRRCDPRLDQMVRSLVGEQRIVVSTNVNSVGVPDAASPARSALTDYAGFATAGAGTAALRFLPRSGGAMIGIGALYQGYRDADRLLGAHATGLDAAALTADATLAAGSVAFLMKAAGRYKIPLLVGGLAARVGVELVNRR